MSSSRSQEQTTAEILRRICATGEVTNDDIDHLFGISKPTCQGCRVNSKDNPNCYCGLVPPFNGFRKTGLWQKTPEVLDGFGYDPSQIRRANLRWPAGLNNLGATCYANSILQCLYMNMKFRAAVFAVEPELLREIPVLDELANLFARLHSSEQAYIDSGPFAKTLNLDNTVQQDSHEFLTLLMTLLENSLGRSNVASAKTIVQDLFRGAVAMVTLCSKCGKISPRIEEFYELQLNVDGLRTLDESLADYFKVEELCGDNQYFCETCGGTLVEGATRSIKLRTLPEVLNFQLKRCVFIPKTTTRKKVTSSISFPGELQMNQRLLEPSDSEIIYDLSAILAHKGAGVDSGHYLSLIKDERTGEWWEFDDEVVSKKGSHPFAEGPPSSTAEPMEIETDLKPPCSELMVVSNGKNHVNVGQSTSSASNTDCRANTFESADAYMLMYTRRSTTGSKDKAFKDKERSSEPLPPNNDKSLPPHLFEEIKAFNELYVTDCRNYKEKKEKETVRISERRQEVRSILSEAPVPSGEEPYFWIATDWLRQWCDGTLPPAIDNTSIQCSHGGVSVLQVGSMKRLSRSAWAQLLFQCGGGPALSNAVHCKDCIRNRANMMVQADNYRDQRSAFKEIADASLAGKSLEGALYFVSRSWLQQWSRRRNVDFPSEADIGPTASIRCPHGELIPEQAAGTKRVLVPEDLWLFLYEDSIKMKPEDALVCTTFLSEAETCAVCHAKANEVASSEETQRAFKVKERQNHEKLLTEKSIALNPGCKYYLLPSSWLTKWKTYLTASARSTLLSARPDPLEGVINSLICEKHSRLLERPLHLVCKHDTISQKPSTTYGLTIISENDWKLFCEDWQCNISKCVSAEIEFISGDVKKLVGSCEEMSISEGNLNPSNDGANDEVESRQSIIKTSPMICEECIGERESRELMQKLSYCNKEISVYLVRGKEIAPPKSVLDASCRVSDPERRSSKRPRKASNGNLVNLTVSGSTTIYQLKMKIWESLEVVKENQMLHKGSNLIDEEESATLADMHIFPGDVLWVRDSGKYQNCDITVYNSLYTNRHRKGKCHRPCVATTVATVCNKVGTYLSTDGASFLVLTPAEEEQLKISGIPQEPFNEKVDKIIQISDDIYAAPSGCENWYNKIIEDLKERESRPYELHKFRTGQLTPAECVDYADKVFRMKYRDLPEEMKKGPHGFNVKKQECGIIFVRFNLKGGEDIHFIDRDGKGDIRSGRLLSKHYKPDYQAADVNRTIFCHGSGGYFAHKKLLEKKNRLSKGTDQNKHLKVILKAMVYACDQDRHSGGFIQVVLLNETGCTHLWWKSLEETRQWLDEQKNLEEAEEVGLEGSNSKRRRTD